MNFFDPKKRPATLGQRMALYNMYSALKWDTKGIRDLSFIEASRKIDEAGNFINKNGFPKRIVPLTSYQKDGGCIDE